LSAPCLLGFNAFNDAKRATLLAMIAIRKATRVKHFPNKRFLVNASIFVVDNPFRSVFGLNLEIHVGLLFTGSLLPADI
jgi:hypothetical protein